MVWRVLNTTDQLKQPSVDFSTQVLEGEVGRKYRERLQEIWDPLFADSKGGKIDFITLFKNTKGLDISGKQLQMFQDFANNYDTIVSQCIKNPKVDTRVQKLGDDKLSEAENPNDLRISRVKPE